MAVYIVYLLLFVLGVISCQDPLADIPKANLKTFNKTNPNIVLKTPFFPGTYPVSKTYGWLIESPEAAADITIRFKYFDLESSKRCVKYDYVMLYKQDNGQSNWDKAGYTEGYCGKLDPFDVTAETKRVLIKFVSDSSRTFSGFNATFEIKITQKPPHVTCLSKLGDDTCNRTVKSEERATITIQCRTLAIPPATFKWQKVINKTHGVDLRSEMVKNTFPNGSIQLQNLNASDEGWYRCIAKNKHDTTSDDFQLLVAEKCLCPQKLRASWYDFPPYTKYLTSDGSNKKIDKGVFYAIMTKMVAAVCGNCTKGHGPTDIIWDDSYNKKKDRGLSDVKSEIENNMFDIYFPIEGLKTDNKYRNVFYFLPIVDSPGVAFLVIGSEEGASAMAIFDSILTGWPILVLTIVMAILAGIIMWMLDTYWNEEQFPRTFSDGIVEGFWWAFVTMTTVGYGDIAPVGVPGRLFAVIWILTGLVIIAIFTGVITTSLTVTALSTNVKLYGTSVGAINNTAEYRMGVIKNAEMTNYSNYDEMRASMNARKVEGCLIDSYVAAYHKDLFKKFRVNNIISANKAYGVVLGKELSKKYIYDAFAEYLEKNKAEIVADIENNVDTLEEPKGSAAEEASADLFDPKSTLFVRSMIGSGVMLLIMTVGGLLFEYGYLRPRHRMIEAAKNLEMVESTEVKEMALRAKMLKDTLLMEVEGFYDRWAEKLNNLTRKHKAEQKKLMTKGTSTGPPPAAWQHPQVEEAVELDGSDGLDKRPSTSGSVASSSGSSSGKSHRSTASLVDNNDEEKKETGGL
ncbi:uncharacterized protein LOC130641408 [Hydractinia symbiolongicarpus]|uniref:uncharacterized protein LOC130641408 n=1 Tax=Hydractinia symbiolongicarpus TaxID=13093 RepID=UPI00254A1A78|nr:uncharacterized protein LOC130641408 [Hydractinia symbiolongicarpus]